MSKIDFSEKTLPVEPADPGPKNPRLKRQVAELQLRHTHFHLLQHGYDLDKMLGQARRDI